MMATYHSTSISRLRSISTSVMDLLSFRADFHVFVNKKGGLFPLKANICSISFGRPTMTGMAPDINASYARKQSNVFQPLPITTNLELLYMLAISWGGINSSLRWGFQLSKVFNLTLLLYRFCHCREDLL